MKTQVEFRSSKFPPYEGEQEQINPGLWGKRLAEYFVRKLSEKGIKTEEIIAEDATAQLTRLTEAMQQILSADPEIKEVVWKGPT